MLCWFNRKLFLWSNSSLVTLLENLFLKQERFNTRTTCTFGLFLWHKKVVLVFKCSFLRTNSLVKQRNKGAGGSENFPLLKVAAHFKALGPIFKLLSGIQTEKSHEFHSLIYLINQTTQLQNPDDISLLCYLPIYSISFCLCRVFYVRII